MTLSPQDPQSEQDVMVAGMDRSPSHPAPVAAPTLRDELAAAMPAAASSSRAAAEDADDLTGKAPSVGGAYIYGYDSAGNPTLTEASCSCSSDRKLPT
jgi:hypothetical protein